MPKYIVSYRGGEITATIEAESAEKACEIFLSGDEVEYDVNAGSFHSDMVEAELLES